jgi:hypothetical protein
MTEAHTRSFDRAYTLAKAAAKAAGGGYWAFNPEFCEGWAEFPPAITKSRRIAGHILRSAKGGHLPASRFWAEGVIPWRDRMKVAPVDLSGQREEVRFPTGRPESDRRVARA